MTFPFAYRGRGKYNANSLGSGVWYLEADSENAEGLIGPIISFRSDQSCIQFIANVFSGDTYVRSIKANGEWSNWRKF